MDATTAAGIRREVRKAKASPDEYGVIQGHSTREVGGVVWVILTCAGDSTGEPPHYDCYTVTDDGWDLMDAGCEEEPSEQDLLTLLEHYRGNCQIGCRHCGP